MKVRLEFKPQDCWVGAYWETRPHDCAFDVCYNNERHLWVCLLPMLPIHFQWRYRTVRP